MSIEYRLDIASIDHEFVKSILSSSTCLMKIPPSLQSPSSGLQIALLDTVDIIKPVIKEEFGFFPSLSLLFRLNKSTLEASKEEMMKVVSSLLAHMKNDCVFLFNGETTLLIQIEGKLKLNDTVDFWKNVDPSKLGIEYEMAHLPNL